jgi:CBS domain-containing protein
MRVQDVMTEGVKTIAPTATAEDTWNMMRFNRIHHLIVTKGGESLASCRIVTRAGVAVRLSG